VATRFQNGGRRIFAFRAVSVLLLAILTSSPAAVAKSKTARATITFRNVFPGGHPEFIEIEVSDSGAATYDIRRLDGGANPQPFHVDSAIVKVIFELAAGLDDFRDVDLGIHGEKANLSEKTFRYEEAGEQHEMTFLSTRNKTATELLLIFSSIARQEGDLADLLRAMRYEPLGVNDALLQIENDYNLLFEPRQLLPALDKVAADDKIIDMARRRASALATRIRLGK
jgi:hypothetical protein